MISFFILSSFSSIKVLIKFLFKVYRFLMFNFTLIYSVIIKDFVVAGIFNDKLGFILVHFDEM